MILDATNFRGEVLDLDTGLKVPKVASLDVDAGVITAYQVDERGKVKRDDAGRALMYKAKGRFLPVPKMPPKCAKLLASAERCVKCASPLTLPGEELCVKCRAKDRGNRLKAIKLDDPFTIHRCESCTRQAVWSVSDEVLVSHVVKNVSLMIPGRRLTGRVGYERGVMVDRRHYCERHYQPPRLLDADGEVIGNLGERTKD